MARCFSTSISALTDRTRSFSIINRASGRTKSDPGGAHPRQSPPRIRVTTLFQCATVNKRQVPRSQIRAPNDRYVGGSGRDDQTQANGKFRDKRTLTVSRLNVRLWSKQATLKPFDKQLVLRLEAPVQRSCSKLSVSARAAQISPQRERPGNLMMLCPISTLCWTSRKLPRRSTPRSRRSRTSEMSFRSTQEEAESSFSRQPQAST